MTGLVQQNAGEFLPALQATAALSPIDRAVKLNGYITWVEDQLLDMPQAAIGMDHHLLDGLYTRTMRAPAGTILTGAIHKRACLTLLIEGDISILTPEGCARMTAPLVFPAAAGVRRLGYCHTDVVWATVHAVQSSTLDEIEAELFDFVGTVEE